MQPLTNPQYQVSTKIQLHQLAKEGYQQNYESTMYIFMLCKKKSCAINFTAFLVGYMISLRSNSYMLQVCFNWVGIIFVDILH